MSLAQRPLVGYSSADYPLSGSGPSYSRYKDVNAVHPRSLPAPRPYRSAERSSASPPSSSRYPLSPRAPITSNVNRPIPIAGLDVITPPLDGTILPGVTRASARSASTSKGRDLGNSNDATRSNQDYIQPDTGSVQSPETDVGSSIWKRALAAFGSTSHNVSEATLAADGEITPIGSESRITVALKEYYLSKAQSGADLPDWLFSEDERRAAGGVRPRATNVKTDPSPNSTSSSTSNARSSNEDSQFRSLSSTSSGFVGKSAISNRFKQARDSSRGVSNSRSSEDASRGTERQLEDPGNPDPNRKLANKPLRPVGVGGGLPSGPRGGIMRH